MARINIDDMFLRDPRVAKLAAGLGWNMYEVRGRLLFVHSLVYDRVKAGDDGTLTLDEVDIVADCRGLAECMVQVELAALAGRGVYIKGSHRAKYLESSEDSGRAGGVASGISRRKRADSRRVPFNETQQPLNLPDPVPDHDHETLPDPERARARAGGLSLVPAEQNRNSERASPIRRDPTAMTPEESAAALAEAKKALRFP